MHVWLEQGSLRIFQQYAATSGVLGLRTTNFQSGIVFYYCDFIRVKMDKDIRQTYTEYSQPRTERTKQKNTDWIQSYKDSSTKN